MKALCKLSGLVLAVDAGDHVAVSAKDAVSLGLELLRQAVGLLAGRRLDADLPGGQPVLEHLALGLEAPRRLVVPAILVGEPVLDRPDRALDPGLSQLCLDDRSRTLGLGARACVDEQGVVVAGDDEPSPLELLRQFAGLRAEVEPEPFEHALGMLVRDVDLDSPVVVHASILAEMPLASRCLVIPPSQNGNPAPRSKAVSTSAALGTTPSSSRWWISSAIAERAEVRISSGGRGSCAATTISSRPAA